MTGPARVSWEKKAQRRRISRTPGGIPRQARTRMALNTVTLTWNLSDVTLGGLAARITLTPTTLLQDVTDQLTIPAIPYSVTFTGGTGQLTGIIACDNTAITPPPGQWAYEITVTCPVQAGSTAGGELVIGPETVFINYVNGTIQDLSDLVPVAQPSPYLPYLLQPAGTPLPGQVPAATGSGYASDWTTLTPADLGAAPVLTQSALQTGNCTAVPGQIVTCSTASGSLTVKLPAAPPAGTVNVVKDVISGTGNTVTVATSGSDVINKSGGGTGLTELLVNQGVMLQYDSGIWVDLADDIPLSQLDTRYDTAGTATAAAAYFLRVSAAL
jgi:hypothetical protein